MEGFRSGATKETSIANLQSEASSVLVTRTPTFTFSRIGFTIQNGVSAQLVARLPAFLLRSVSLLTCSKLCGVCFVAGIMVGFTLKRRLRRWAASLLSKIKD
ncbi:hypothetical protein R6Q59_023708 [Mikania micrantha]